jgi:hypothetical protein
MPAADVAATTQMNIAGQTNREASTTAPRLTPTAIAAGRFRPARPDGGVDAGPAVRPARRRPGPRRRSKPVTTAAADRTSVGWSGSVTNRRSTPGAN